MPFVVLLVLVGMLGTAVATARLSIAATTEFDAGLLRASLLANDHLEILEAERLAQLRTATDTLGVPEAVSAADRDSLARLLVPITANALPVNLIVRVLNVQSAELIAIRGTPSGPVLIPASDPPDRWSGNSVVRDVLAGRADPLGERSVFVLREAAGPVAYWIGPVRAQSDRVVGAVLVGEAVSDIAQGIQGSALYDPDGVLLGSSLPSALPFPDQVPRQVTNVRTVRITVTRGERTYGELFSQWSLRGRQLGYLAVSSDAGSLMRALAQTRLLLAMIFTAAGLLTLVVGSVLASRITRPLEELTRATRVIAAGDLRHRAPVRSKDEIGDLARSFNAMTASLGEKTAELEETYFSSMEALARAIDARDPYTFGHSSRVAAISAVIASAMGLPAKDLETLRRSALLHDIGKIGIEDRVLRKPSRLSDEEFDSMRAHPVIGYDMLKGVRFLHPSLPGVRHHHERWDGQGYPDGLAGDAIPIAVRILTVADVFDALTSERPYRSSLGFEAATREIVAEVGTRFDPAVVTAFLSSRATIAVILAEMARVRRLAEAPILEGVS